jgi:hypothetical protein
MRAGKGKILIKFSKALIDKFEKEQPKYLNREYGRLIFVNDYKSFSYNIDVSIEVGQVVGINDKQKNIAVGDYVFLSYLVFVSGRYDHKSGGKSKPNNLLITEPNGDEIYFANDGTDDNDSDIYAKITPQGVEMMPGYIIINEPQKIRKIGLIVMPENYTENRDEDAYWATALNVSNYDKKENGFEEGDRILCRGGFYYEIKTGGASIYAIRPRYILAKNDFEAYA